MFKVEESLKGFIEFNKMSSFIQELKQTSISPQTHLITHYVALINVVLRSLINGDRFGGGVWA
jgi:hypothetical protein